ncbi:hypothetical protein [Marinospirillum perlucidum]|uniref:hypothetical protein n=1 Tax=Marinospirillum perlucidum TaxID=1982602 RepID=UPI000DF463C1|nr:hypothetical protein [Marinospirillum perlucidum]
MQCIDAQRQLQSLDLDQQPSALVAEHLRHCNQCHDFYEDFRLRLHLESFAVPEPDPGFLQQAMKQAGQRQHRASLGHRAWTAAVAASLLVALLLVGRWQLPEAPSPKTAMQLQPQATSEQQLKEVRILIVSDQDYQDAHIQVALHEDLQLRGYDQQKNLSWRTPLKEGQNLLTLPIQIGQKGGQLEVTSRLGMHTHSLQLPLARGEQPSG